MAVLFVDDEALARNLFSQLLAKTATIYSAENVKEALDILERHHNSIGLVISDYAMKNGYGSSLLKQCMTLYPNIHRCLLTAVEAGQFGEELKLGVIQTIMCKPFEKELMRKLVGDHDIKESP